MPCAPLFIIKTIIFFLLTVMAACTTQPLNQETVRICNSDGCIDRPKDYVPPDSIVNQKTLKDSKIEALEELAEKDPTAAYDLGLRYFRGEGVLQNSYQSIKWMRAAAERGNLKAQMALGRLYLTGLGEMGSDPGEAERWLMITSNRGDKEAKELLKAATKARMSKQMRYQLENRWRSNFYNNWHYNYPYHWQWGVNQWTPIQPIRPSTVPYPRSSLSNDKLSDDISSIPLTNNIELTQSQNISATSTIDSHNITNYRDNNQHKPSTSTILNSEGMAPDTAVSSVDTEKKADQSDTRRIALVIGNGAYQHTGKLLNPVNDAHDIAQALKRSNFQVILKIDASLEVMGDAIYQFGESLKGGGIGLFYYSGHGIQVKGENYLLPVDTNLMREDEIKRKAISVSDLLEKMGEGKSHLNLVFLDACRNNPFPGRTRGMNRGLSNMNAPNGTLLVFSTNPDNVAEDGKGRNGTYTRHLLNYIDQPGLEIGMMLRQIRTKVKEETGGKQVPWENGSIEGVFYFQE